MKKRDKDHVNSIWEFTDDKQRDEMLETIDRNNCGKKLKLVREISGMSRKDLAQILGCSESTITRLETLKSQPTDDFMLRLNGLVVIGHAKYSKMTEKEKENLSEIIGVSGGVLTGVGGAIGAISTSGVIGGLSAAGITSGLSAIGGTMLGGLAVVASIPVAVGAAGFGVVKGIKKICEANKLSCKEVDEHFEIVRDSTDVDDQTTTDDNDK